MDARGSAVEQFAALLRGPFDSEFEGRRVVVAVFESQEQFWWQRSSAKARHSLDARRAGNGHDTGHDGHGDSRGYWDGDSLVVETLNFLRETSFLRGGSTAELRLTERFTRESPEILRYEVTVDDPSTWTRPWTYEVPMQLNPDPIYEYACHEGNYGMETILVGARQREAEEAAAR